MQTPEPTDAAGQPANTTGQRAQLPFSIPLTYVDTDGQYVMAYPRSVWDTRRHQVMVGGDCNTDTLCVVDDFGALVVTHRRDPASPCGMTMKAVQ